MAGNGGLLVGGLGLAAAGYLWWTNNSKKSKAPDPGAKPAPGWQPNADTPNLVRNAWNSHGHPTTRDAFIQAESGTLGALSSGQISFMFDQINGAGAFNQSLGTDDQILGWVRGALQVPAS